jgi:hypothetical protein
MHSGSIDAAKGEPVNSEEVACLHQLSAASRQDGSVACPICHQTLKSDSIGEIMAHVSKCSGASPDTNRKAP